MPLFDYGMDARTLKTIRIKKRLFTEEAKLTMLKHNIDTAKISIILRHGDVDFSKGKPRKKPCADYYVMGKDSLKHVNMLITRCDSTATIKKVIVN
jgi:hypothetical protein